METEARETHHTVLVVDDEQVVCQACRRVLIREGFVVETTSDPDDGLRRALSGTYAAILLDVKMPTMDGIHFLRILRQNQVLVPVVVMTGYPIAQNAVAAARLGASDYVVKPFTPEEITRAVKKAVSGEPPHPEQPKAHG